MQDVLVSAGDTEALDLHLELVRAGSILRRLKSDPTTRLGDLWEAQNRFASAQAALLAHRAAQAEAA